ncbi:hybrid sensor histidine kinase/response regulator, partial [Pseudomonas aeruginosa]|nr:hybrid sensor histidine kinase/response regulator [Pseudomonas aeruginosa]
MHAATGRAEVRIMEALPIRNRRLLVIDERQADRDRVCGLLQGTREAESPPVAPERGYQVDTAGSAEEAFGGVSPA